MKSYLLKMRMGMGAMDIFEVENGKEIGIGIMHVESVAKFLIMKVTGNKILADKFADRFERHFISPKLRYPRHVSESEIKDWISHQVSAAI